MSKKMLINASHSEENRVAIVVDGTLSELDIEIAGQEQTKGNIYKAVVTRVESGLQAAFVDYGAEKMGFLQIGEIHPNLYPQKVNQDSKSRPRINEILQRGQEILIQVVKEERGTKGAALTTFLSLPGRYMVLMPDSKTKGVSRKITDESERKQLKRTMAELNLPEKMGYIVRTAGIGKEQEELKRDFDYLVSLYQGILSHKEQSKAPAQLYQESNLVIRSIRDYFSSEIDEVLIDDPKVFKEAKDFFSLVMPEQSGLVKQHRERRPIFSRFQIEDQIDGLARNQIPLPSGGSIVIDQTEALVAIDVNSGKMSSESGIEATAGKTNVEAAAEVGRQLRLRDLGGLIVIDFIDMRDRQRIREVEQTLKKSLRDDKAKVTVGRISQFGLLEMSRQRIKGTLSVGAFLDCPHCQGIGRIKSIEAQAIAFLRQAHSAASNGQIVKIEARCPLDTANYLLNEKRSALGELEKQLNLTISIEGRPEFVPGQVELELLKREKQQDQQQTAEPVSHANKIEEALAAMSQEKPEAAISAEEPEGSETTTPEAEENTGRKRRRRRRRRGGRKETDEQPAETTENTEGGSAVEQADISITNDQTVDTAASTRETETEAAKKPDPKPRNRRGAKKTTIKEEAATSPVAETAPAAVSEVETTEAGKRTATTEKPKRQSTRKPAVEKPAKPAESAEDKKLSSNTETEVKPKRRAPRKTSAKTKALEVLTETEGKATDKKVDQNTNKEDATEKPKRRSPSRKNTAKDVEAKAKPSAGKQLPADKSPVVEKTQEKPQKRSQRKVTTKTDPVAVQQSSAAEKKSISSTAGPANEAKKRTPSRKTAVKPPAKRTTETKQKTDMTENSKEKTNMADADKPKRQTIKKSASTKSDDIVSEPSKDSMKKPRTPRKATTKKTEPLSEKSTKSPSKTSKDGKESDTKTENKKKTINKTAKK